MYAIELVIRMSVYVVYNTSHIKCRLNGTETAKKTKKQALYINAIQDTNALQTAKQCLNIVDNTNNKTTINNLNI